MSTYVVLLSLSYVAPKCRAEHCVETIFSTDGYKVLVVPTEYRMLFLAEAHSA